MDWSATVVNDRTESHRRSLIIRDHNQSARRVAISFVSSDRLRQQSAPFADDEMQYKKQHKREDKRSNSPSENTKLGV